MNMIVVDPVRDRLYFALRKGGLEVINVDGSSRKWLADDFVYSLAVDVKEG